MLQFEITDEEEAKVQTWLKETVYPAVIERQKERYKNAEGPFLGFRQACEQGWKDGIPYEGTIGRKLRYEFQETSVATIKIARYDDYKLDLSDYYNW